MEKKQRERGIREKKSNNDKSKGEKCRILVNKGERLCRIVKKMSKCKN